MAGLTEKPILKQRQFRGVSAAATLLFASFRYALQPGNGDAMGDTQAA